MNEDEPDFLVNLSDVGRAGYCNKAARAFCRERGLPWMQFIRPGLSAKLLLSLNHAGVDRVVAAARGRLHRKLS